MIAACWASTWTRAPTPCTSSTTTWPRDGKVYGRLSKTTANSATAPTTLTGETPILDNLPSYSADVPGTGDDSHTIGTVLVAPDHTVFVGVGDGSSYLQADVSATNAQNLDSPRGKIFHVDGNGHGLSSNPFWVGGDSDAWRNRVYAYGLRNPFRFTLEPGSSDTLYIGDVGWNTWEEIDVATSAGDNFGWPCWEGPLTAPHTSYQSLAFCQAAYASPPADLKDPLYLLGPLEPQQRRRRRSVRHRGAVRAVLGCLLLR